MTDQPPPVPGDGVPVWDEAIARARGHVPEAVLAAMRDRDRVGRERYGQPLQRGDGRDHLADAYQEALDLYVYLVAARVDDRLLDLVLDVVDRVAARQSWR